VTTPKRSGPKRSGPKRSGPVARIGAVLAVLLAAGTVSFLSAPAASAHALIVSSTPAAGSDLTQLPKAVTVTFSEEIVPKLSSLTVVDSAGHKVNSAASHAVKGNALQLAVSLPTLHSGVYTVQWHTVSSDDGHATGGTFTFGVGPLAYAAMSGPAPALVSAASSASPLGVAGTWLFDSGLGLLVGGCWIALYGYPAAGRRTLILALGGGGALLLGLVLTGWSQMNTNGIPLGELASTSLGLGLIAQAIPGAAAGVGVALALRLPLQLRLRDVWRRAALAVALVMAAVSAGAHVLTTHAASGRNADFELLVQWAHVAAYATWIGGLAALLLSLGTRSSPQKAAAVRRFSKVAGYSLGALVLSGVLRAFDEVGAFASLMNSLFGRLVLVKVGLVAALAALGAYNRYRAVPAAEDSLTGLRRAGTAELTVAALALVAAATLSSSLPPAFVLAAPKPVTPPHFTVNGVASGVHASLEVSPGYPGPNRFTLRAYDSTGHALTKPVTLVFTLPSRPDIAATTLDLTPGSDGSQSAIGDQMALTGQWSVTADVKPAKGQAATVPFTVGVTISPDQIQSMTMGRMTMIYGIQLTGGRQLEAYLTPDRPGSNTLHVLFTDQRDAAITLSAAPTVTVHRDGSAATRTVTMYDIDAIAITRNNYYARTTFTSGRWDFHVAAVTADGVRLSADFALTIS
jgi:copper transport protein